MITADYHVHSNFSSDSTAPMEHMVDRAIQLGMKKLCFTDHMDFDFPAVGELTFVFDMEEYLKKITELREQYDGKIQLLTGIELGLQPHLGTILNDFIPRYPLDFIIGSSHVVDGMDPYYPQYWESKTVEEGIRAYFQSIIDNCKAINGFHVYGHLDYIIRYVPGMTKEKADYAYPLYRDILDEVLSTLISQGKGIEINTAGYKYGLGYPHPKAEILNRYRELGGELITIGSDAHDPQHLCYDFKSACDLLLSLGFQYYATFLQGRPVFEKL